MQIDCQTFFISCVCSFDGGQHQQGTGGRISGPGNPTKNTKTTDKGRPHTRGTRQQHYTQDKTQGEYSTTQVHRRLLQNHHTSTAPTTTSIPPSSPLHSPMHAPMHHARPRASSPPSINTEMDRRWDPRRHDERKNTDQQTEEENVLEMLWAAYV